MTVALAGRAPATFEIKSANLPLVALLLKSTDLQALATELAARFGEIPEFFDNDPLVIDLSPLQAQEGGAIDFGALLALLRSYRVLPVAARGGNPAQMAAALQAGLAPAAEAVAAAPAPQRGGAWMPPDRSPGQAPQVRHDKSPGQAPRVGDDKSLVQAPRVRHDKSPPAAEPGHASALIIDKPLRSGQQIYARGRDLVMLSMVNAGAEVIADGHIHVYAPLRGKAIAGARGNTEARIIALCLEAELISIAGVYRTSEVPLPAGVLSRPTQVRLVGGAEGKLVMEPLK